MAVVELSPIGDEAGETSRTALAGVFSAAVAEQGLRTLRGALVLSALIVLLLVDVALIWFVGYLVDVW
jgi:hypothetical protein